MVKVKEEAVMAEPKPAAAAPQTSNNNSGSTHPNSINNNLIRKPRGPHTHPPHAHHVHFPHYTHFHHHCTYPATDNGDGGAATNGSTPAKFYFGPGFEPQQQIPGGGGFGPGPSQSQSGEYVVFFHVNPGVTINFQFGDNLEVLRGPVTVPMVSTNSSPPIAMPVQVPPGHVVQQIVDESGTLRHVILSPQHPAGLVPLPSHTPQHYGANPTNSSSQPQQYYQSLPGFAPQHFHSNLQPGHSLTSPSHLGHSPPPNPSSYYKDERTQRQHIKLKKKLHEKQQKIGGDTLLPPRKELMNGLKRSPTSTVKEKGMNSVGTSEDGEESSVADEDDTFQIITDILSSVQAPKVSELTSRSALLQWAAPNKLSESSSNDSHEIDIVETDLRYEVLLSDKSKEMKFKSIYSGASLSCRIQDLKPGQEYSVCLQVHYDELQGSATDPMKFTTPACEPDQPQPPKLIHRSKNSVQLRWSAANDNGAHIIHYVLEYDDGKGGEFMEYFKSRAKQHTLQKLQPATNYRFRLAAVNDVGKSAYSEAVTYSTLDYPPTQPTPPTLVEATVDSLHLQWTRRSRDEEFTLKMNDLQTNYGHITVYHGKENSYIHRNLAYFSEYAFRLRAQNESGVSQWSEDVVYKTLPARPARPSKPVLKGRTHAHSFKLKWEPPSETGGAKINKYVLEVNSGSGYETVYTGGDTEAVCDKLTPGTTYQLRVSCCSDGGTSNYSDPCTVTTDPICPGKCAQPRLHGKAKASSVAIKWQEPDYNGGAPVQEYEVEMVSPDASRSIVHKSKETECTVTDLGPGQEYEFAVRAVNRIGAGAWSEGLRLTSGAAPPSQPEIPSIVAKSPFHVFVEWRAPISNGAPITEYKLEQSPTQDEFNFNCIYQGVQTNYDVKNLSPFSTYYFRVMACNGAGCSAYSPVAATITPPAPPAMVSAIRSVSTPTSITLQWNAPLDNGAAILYYNIEIGDRTICTESPTTEYTIDNLHPETLYKIKVQAVNNVAAGAYSSTLRMATLKLPPIAPRLECIGVGHNYLKLKWGDGKNTDYTQYCVEMENGRTHEFQCIYKGTALNYKVNKLHEITTYKFRINASNDAGTGEYSDEYEFKTSISPPAVLRIPKVSEIEQHGCVLEWTPARNAFSDQIIYQVQVARLKEQNFSQSYKGTETRCALDNLEAGVEYSAKVCPIRITSTNGELLGPCSPPVNFVTLAGETATIAKLSTVHTSYPTHPHKGRSLHHSIRHILRPKSLSDKQYHMFYAILVALVGIMLSMLIMWALQ